MLRILTRALKLSRLFTHLLAYWNRLVFDKNILCRDTQSLRRVWCPCEYATHHFLYSFLIGFQRDKFHTTFVSYASFDFSKKYFDLSIQFPIKNIFIPIFFVWLQYVRNLLGCKIIQIFFGMYLFHGQLSARTC